MNLPLASIIRRFALTILLGVFAVSPALAEELHRFVYEKIDMGITFRITLYAPDEAKAKAAVDAAFDRIAVLNSILSDYDPDSELSRLSMTSGSGRAVPVSEDLWNVLQPAQELAAKTDGAFDVTVGPMINLWRRSRRKQELPEAALLAEMKDRSGYQHLTLNPKARTATLAKPDMRLDLGAIAKGYACDEALKSLEKHGISSALVTGAGDMAAGAPPPGQPGWRIELAPLDAPGAPPATVILLNRSAIATSGDIYQRLEIGGKRYSHIVDPRTGMGLTDHSLVTILAPTCMQADSLSTTVSVLDPEKGLALIESLPGVECRVVRMPNDEIEVRTSKGWPGQAAK